MKTAILGLVAGSALLLSAAQPAEAQINLHIPGTGINVNYNPWNRGYYDNYYYNNGYYYNTYPNSYYYYNTYPSGRYYRYYNRNPRHNRVYYYDSYRGRQFWIDNKGRRHYR